MASRQGRRNPERSKSSEASRDLPRGSENNIFGDPHRKLALDRSRGNNSDRRNIGHSTLTDITNRHISKKANPERPTDTDSKENKNPDIPDDSRKRRWIDKDSHGRTVFEKLRQEQDIKRAKKDFTLSYERNERIRFYALQLKDGFTAFTQGMQSVAEHLDSTRVLDGS